MRVVCRKHEDFFRAKLVDYLQELGLIWRRVNRLSTHTHVLSDVVGWEPSHPRYFTAQTLPVFVETPHQRGHPSEAAFHERDPRSGESIEHSLHYHAHNL